MLGLSVDLFFSPEKLVARKKKSINLSYIFVKIPSIILCKMFKEINIFTHLFLLAMSLMKKQEAGGGDSRMF